MHLANHKAEYIDSMGSLQGAPKRRVMLLPSMMTAIYGWHPNGLGTLGGFRMGGHNLLADVAGNDALEFLYGHGVPDPRSNP